MLSRSILIRNHLCNLEVLTKADKKFLGKMFERKTNSKVEKSNNYLKSVTYSLNIRHSDKKHRFYSEYSNLKLGDKDWFNKLSKSYQSYIGWYLQNRYLNEIKEVTQDVPDKIYNSIISKCYKYVVGSFRDEFLTDNGDVKDVIINEYYFSRKLPETYYDRLFRLLQYAVEDKRYDMFVSEDVLDKQCILDYCLMDETIPSSVAEKIRVSVSRTMQNFDAYAKANVDKFKYFITLTFADVSEKEKHIKLNELRKDNEYNINFNYVKDIKSLEECNKAMHSFFTYLKKGLKKKDLDLYYLGCPEYQSNGNVHYHFLFSDIPDEFIYKVPAWLDYDSINKKYQDGKGLVHWTYGKSDIEVIQDKNRISTYISKYIGKSLNEIDGTVYFERLNKKRYYASRNLDKPEVFYDEVIDFDEVDYKEYYMSFRKSSFNDNEITDILFTLND